MSFKRSSDYSIEFTIGGPFQRLVVVNFVQKGEKLIVIPTSGWVEELRIFPYAYVNSSTMRATFEGIGEYGKLFQEKYGIEHFERYFSGVNEVIVLEPWEAEPRYDKKILGTIFDRVVDQYCEDIESNWVQRHMREKTAGILNTYARDGSAILDLGCGPKSEVLEIQKEVKITETDISQAALKKSQGTHSGTRASTQWVLQTEEDNLTDEYDIVFSSYGYLNVEDIHTIAHILDQNLKTGGYFIGSFMNRYGLLDLFLSLLKNKGEYIRERMNGRLTVGQGRYNSLSFPRRPIFFDALDGLRIKYRNGVCAVIPPYNYRRLVSLTERVGFFPFLDSLVGKIPLSWVGSDYVVFVYQKVGKVTFT